MNKVVPDEDDDLLTTAEVAEKLGTSPAYVTMLFTNEKLGRVVIGEGGMRQVHASSVLAYLAEHPRPHGGMEALQEAAREAGMYEIPEEHYGNLARDRRVSDEPEADAP